MHLPANVSRSAVRRMRPLVVKEVRQMMRARHAFVVAGLLPCILLFSGLPSARVFPDLYRSYLLPAAVVGATWGIVGLNPMHGFLSERERRTLDLLFGLPFRPSEIVMAKMVAVTIVGLFIVGPLLVIVLGIDLAIGVITPLYIPLAMAVLIGGFLSANGPPSAVAILVRDYRSASVVGLFVTLPELVALGAVLVASPSDWKLPLFALTLTLVGLIGIAISTSVLTVNRYWF